MRAMSHRRASPARRSRPRHSVSHLARSPSTPGSGPRSGRGALPRARTGRAASAGARPGGGRGSAEPALADRVRRGPGRLVDADRGVEHAAGRPAVVVEEEADVGEVQVRLPWMRPARPQCRGSRRRGGGPGARSGSPRRGSPAASSAATLDSAVPAPPEMIAPAWPIRLPSGAVRPAMKATFGTSRAGARAAQAAAVSSAAPPISPISTIASVSGRRGEQLEDVEEGRADDRVAADADARRLAEPGVGHRLDRLVGERARAADDADPALAVDRARDDADLGPSRRRGAGAVRPDEPRAGAPDAARRPGACRAPGCPR